MSLENEPKEEPRIRTELGSSKTYTSSKDKYENLNSSASSLFFCGALVIAALILKHTGIFNIPLTPLTETVLAVMALASIAGGFISKKQAKEAKEMISTEDHKREEQISWFTEKFTADMIDQAIIKIDGELPMEIKSFKRMEWISSLLVEHFNLSNEAYVDDLTEEIYEKVFQE